MIRLRTAGVNAVLLNLPAVVSIAFLMDNDQLTFFTGKDYGLPPGHRTSLFAMIMLRLGSDNGSILQDPNWVLDPGELALIQSRIDEFNAVIDAAGAAAEFPVLDISQLFADVITEPPVVRGRELSNCFGGGLFSLDGIHASNTGYGLLAQETIRTANNAWGLGLRPITDSDIARIALTDPHIDKDGDGRVTGRLGAGLLETIMFLLGISGDFVDFPTPPAAKRSL